jgi:hypothetical protein
MIIPKETFRILKISLKGFELIWLEGSLAVGHLIQRNQLKAIIGYR